MPNVLQKVTLRKRLIDPTPQKKEPVFHDPLGGRSRLLNRLLLLTGIVLSVWLILFMQVLLQPPSLQNTHLESDKAVLSGDIVQASPAQTTPGSTVQRAAYARHSGHFSDQKTADLSDSHRCKAQPSFGATALANSGDVVTPTVFALLPADDLNGYLSFVRNCQNVDVLVPEMYEISAGSFSVNPLKIDTEMVGIIDPILRAPATRPVLMPSIALAFDADVGDFLARLQHADFRQNLVDDMRTAAQRRKAQGLCISTEFGAGVDLVGFMALLKDMKASFAKAGLATCISITEDGELWKIEPIVDVADVVIVKMFRTVWAGSKPGALAPDHQFAAVLDGITAKVGKAKLVIALGNQAVDWISGQVLPETLPIAKAFKRIGDANATLDFEGPSLNSYSSFVDAKGDRHQIWMLYQHIIKFLIYSLPE